LQIINELKVKIENTCQQQSDINSCKCILRMSQSQRRKISLWPAYV